MTELDAIRDEISKSNSRMDEMVGAMGNLTGRVAALESRKNGNGNGNGGVNWKQIFMILAWLAAGGGTATVMSAITPSKESSPLSKQDVIELIKTMQEK